MRIGIDARTLNWPGMARYTRELCQHLAKIDDRNEYLIYAHPSEAFDPPAANFKRVDFSSPIQSVREQWQLPAVLKRDRIDVLHAITTLVGPIFAPCPVVSTLHDLNYRRHPEFMPGFAAKAYLKLFHDTAMRRATRIVTVSGTTRDDLLHFYSGYENRAQVIYNGILPHWRVVDDDRIADFRQRHGLDRKFLLYVGTFKEHKNVPTLIRGYNRLPRQIREQYALVLLGWKDVRNLHGEIQLAVAEMEDEVVTLPRLSDEDLVTLYNAAEVFVMPSFTEGFCFPIVESMACGTPVVSSSSSVMPEVLGDAALFFDPRSPDELAERLGQVLGQPPLLRQLSAAGLEQAKKYSWEIAAPLYLREYELAAGKA